MVERKSDIKKETEIEDLVTDLRSTLITKRLRAVRELGKLKYTEAVEPLTHVLNDRSRDIRCAAIEALYQISPSNLSKLIIPLTRDKSADVRLRAARALNGCDDDEAFEALVALLYDVKDEVANMAAKSLSKQPVNKLSALIKLFSDNSWKIRSRAAMAITKMGRLAVEALKAAVDDKDSNIRFWAITCLGHLRDRSNTNLLLSKLQDSDTGVRVAALRALREIGDPNIASKLFEALSQPSEQVRDLVYEILRDFGTHSIPYLMDSLSNEYWMGRNLAAQALTDMGNEAVSPLVSALQCDDKERRFWSIKILGKMHEKSAFNEILGFLNDSDPEIKMAALEALSDFGDPIAIPHIIKKFIDPAWVVRKSASKSIVVFEQLAVQPLLKILTSDNEDMKYWALRALGEIKPKGIVPVLLQRFKDKSWTIKNTTAEVLSLYGEETLLDLTTIVNESNDLELKYWIIRTIGKIQSPKSLMLLYQLLGDPSESLRDATQKALSNYGLQIVEDLFALLKTDNRRVLESISSIFQQMGAKTMVPVLCEALGKYDEHLNYWIRRVLVTFKKDALQSVLKLLESSEEEVRRQAILCIGQIGTSKEATIIEAHLKDEYWPARIAAAEVLGELGDTSVVPSLAEILEDEDEDLASAAVISLGKLNDERAIPALISTLQREAWSLRFHAIRILGEMHVTRAFIDLLRLLDEDTLDLKNHIIKALSQIPHVRCFEELKKRFEKETDSDSRLAYIEALSVIGDSSIIPVFIKLCQQKANIEERRAAIRALGTMHAVQAKSALLQALKDGDSVVGRDALASLELILTPEEYKKTEAAISVLRKKQDAFKKSFDEGMNQMRLGNLKKAEELLKSAVGINPRAAYVYSALGNLYYKSGKLIDATKAYVMATNITPDDVTLKLNLGMVYYRRRAYKDAKEIFTKIAKTLGPSSQQGSYSIKMLNKINKESEAASAPKIPPAIKTPTKGN
jgi:HEAT repeat protein